MESYTEMIHRAAINIAGKGKPTFPCKGNKAPCTPRGFKDATTDPGRVTALWNHYGGEKKGRAHQPGQIRNPHLSRRR